MSDEIMVAKGATSQVRLYKDRIKITNDWWLTKRIPFWKPPSKTISIEEISGIKIEEATKVSGGHIKFGESGHEESVDGFFDELDDENTVPFNFLHNDEFLRLRDEINELRQNRNSSTEAGNGVEKSAIETLRQRYAEGEISKEEFEERMDVLQ
ncbi:SHOCT domain-containing protein [Halobacterium salinarum]|uniref:SHOCT domain-containing protein n=1 Tax=Halobacterium salinarum TaxID=2242 RepID=UPI00255402B2|nr:SHOCT domain-containing protein [Halobacterium salinarum]MDL0118700.1 SHOCT domain-containing protein [Halobacterium salinarum]MDL0137799.1 SHOCT domain-containing protein [Halobacterium salinarum]MDL0140883.1 SHOCT domain-containing protein [Halobacterium salinarum]